MYTLDLNDNKLSWDCEKLEVTFNGQAKVFDTIWELEEYLDHTYGVMLVNEESLVDETIH